VAQRIGGGRIGPRFEEAHARLVTFVLFDLHRDLVHDRHRLFGPFARRRLGAQHHRIGTVIDRIGDVGDFGARRGGAFDHRFEHLRRHDHRLARGARGIDDPFLQWGDFLRLKLDPQIAARHHDPVAEFDDFAQPPHRHRLFDLGAQSGPAADQLARFGKVFGALHEAQAHPVNALFDGKGKIAAVLLGQRGDRHFGIGHVHALAIGDYPANLRRTENFIGTGADHPQADLAIVDQQPLALFENAEEFRVRQAGARFIAGCGIAVEREVARMPDHRLPVLERAYAQLGPLQVRQDRDRAAIFLFERPDRRNGFAVDCVIAVAHVDAEGIGPRLEQPRQHLRRAAGRADGCEDLDLAAPWIEPIVRWL